MPHVLVRNVPDADLDVVRAAAAERGESMQEYLLATLLQRAAYLRRQEGLLRAADRLHGREGVPDEARAAALGAFDEEIERRGSALAVSGRT